MFRAKLDQNGLYLGLEEVAEILEGDIELGEDCGLKVGKYRWNFEHNRFDPLPKSQHKIASNVPSYEEALFSLISVMPSPPSECVKWAEWYKTTIGGIK